MAVAGSVDVALDIFGGLVTDMAPADLPAGVSFDCQDVQFIPGSVKTRPGLQSVFAAIAGTPKVNYLKTYVPPTGLLRLLTLDAAGSLWKESSVGVLSLISSGIVPGSFAKSTSLFTREYLAIGDGKYGIDIPRQFDDTNLDRVSQGGPGASPQASDETASYTIAAPAGGLQPDPLGTIAAAPNGLTQSGTLVTVTLLATQTIPVGCVAGSKVLIAGAGVGGYNGTWTVTKIIFRGSVSVQAQFQFISNTSGLANSGGGSIDFGTAQVVTTTNTNFIVGQLIAISGAGSGVYNGTFTISFMFAANNPAIAVGSFGLTASGSGTIAAAGNITAGVHKVSVVFETRQGYFTAPSPPAQWTAAGGKRVTIVNIPTGPPNVTARILLFTLSGQSFFFYSSGILGVFSSNFIINDNTTTTVNIDFTDNGLAAGISADFLFSLVELGECSGVINYGSRLFWWGERDKLDNVLNFSFDGGFALDAVGRLLPLGWIEDSVFYAGGADAVTTYPALPVVWGNAYSITGNGVTATRGLMTQSLYQDADGVAIIEPNTGYSVRARLARNSTLSAGTVHIHMQSTSLGIDAGLDVTAAQLSTSYVEFTAVLTAGLATPPSDLVIKVYADGTPTNSGVFLIDSLEIFPTKQPFNASIVRASLAESPESYDGVTGFLSVSENDGFAVRSAFVIRENLYFVKEHGIYVTQDDGTNEPNQWKITEVSRKVGTPSVNGVAVGEDWAVIAHRTGLYYTSGGEPKKICQEIQPTWDRINWAAGQAIWTQVDLQNKRIYIGVPLDGATSCNKILMLDYRGVSTADELPSAEAIHTSYSGKLLVLEKSRKWSPWTIAANSGAIVERFDGTQQMFLGNGAGNGKIYQLADAQFTDDGVKIPDYYTTYFHFTHDLEQAFQIGSHNKLYTYLSAFIEGAGQISIFAIPPGNAPAGQIATISLSNPALEDIEFPINVTAVRAAFKISTVNSGDWFRLARFIVNAIKSPTAPVRGWN